MRRDATVRGLCLECNVYPQLSSGVQKGIKRYKKYCDRCCKHKYRKEFKYKATDKTKCNHCNFVPLHPCQMDIDHIDGNHHNNSPDNLQSLCANCHRLKTFLNQENKNK